MFYNLGLSLRYRELTIIINISGCNDSYWGVFCHTLCGSCLDEEPCNAENGNCENGCAPGFIDPPFCVTRKYQL